MFFRNFLILLCSIFFCQFTFADNIEMDIPSRYCSEHFAMLTFTFENTSNDWAEYSDITLDFGSEKLNDSVEIVLGDRLVAWYEAHDLKVANSNKVKGIILGSVALLSTIAIDSSSETVSSMQNVSRQAVALGGTALTIGKISEALKLKIFPEGHLLQKNTIVPAGFKINRWVLLSTKNLPDKSLLIENVSFIAKNNGSSVSQSFKIRAESGQAKFDGCRWQKTLSPFVAKPRAKR